MKRFLTISLILMLCSGFAYSQITIKGLIIDSNSRSYVQYASVYQEGTNIGCFSDNNGRFILRNLKAIPDSLTISCIGYNSKKIYLNDLDTSKYLSIELDLKKVSLEEVYITSEKLKTKTKVLGTGKRIILRGTKIWKGWQCARYFQCEKDPSYIESFSFFVEMIEGGRKARVRIYNIDSIRRTPNNDILNANLIIEDLKRGWNTVDLSEHRILIPRDGFFIGLESIMIDNDGFEKEEFGHGVTKYSNFSIGCAKEKTITARKNMSFGDYVIHDGRKIYNNILWSLDSPNHGFDLLYKVKIKYYK